DLVMDMRRAAGIGDGFDGAEIIFAGGSGQETAEPLEMTIPGGMGVPGMEVNAIAVALPDFDEGVPDGIAAAIQDAAAQVSDFADGRGEAVIDDDEVIIGVERQFVRVKRAFGLGGRAQELLGEGAGDGEQRRAQTERLQKPTTVGKGVRVEGQVHNGEYALRGREIRVNSAGEGRGRKIRKPKS